MTTDLQTYTLREVRWVGLRPELVAGVEPLTIRARDLDEAKRAMMLLVRATGRRFRLTAGKA